MNRSEGNTMANFHYAKRSNVLFASELRAKRSKQREVKTPVVEDDSSTKEPYSRWGEDNNFPNWLIEQLSDNPYINPNFHFRSCYIYSGKLRYGIVTGYERVGLEYEEVFVPLKDKRVEEWLSKNNIKAYFFEILKDLLVHWHGAPVLSFNDNKTYINNLTVADWAHCRLEKQNASGAIEHIYRDPNFPNGDVKTWKKYPTIDRYNDPIASVQNYKGTSKEFIYPLTIYGLGKIYYQDPAWQAILKTSWPGVTRKVAQFKDYFLAKQMGAMYVIHVPYSFWVFKYPEWEAHPEKQAQWREETINDMDSRISGIDKVGQNLFLTFKEETEIEKSTKFVIEPLSGNKMFDGVHIEDSQEAASNTYAALAFNQEILGSRPGKTSGGGSGSNIREGGSIEQLANQLFSDWALEVLNFIARFNKWQVDGIQIEFQHRQTVSRTLNLGGVVETANPSGVPTKQSEKK